MKMTSEGSAVLLIVMIMGILTAFLITTLQEGTFLRMFIGKQIIAERYNSLGQGLLLYGIAQAKKNYNLLAELQDAEIEVPLEGCLGLVSLTRGLAGIIIIGQILRGKEVVFKASCRLSQNSDKKFIIQGFQTASFAL